MNLVMKRVENSVGKGEKAGYQHFLPIPHYFQKAFVRVVKSQGCVVKSSLYHTIPTFNDPVKEAF